MQPNVLCFTAIRSILSVNEKPLDMVKYHFYLKDCYFKVPWCISSPLLSLIANVNPGWMNSMTPKGSSFFRTVMLTSLWLPRRLGGVLWLLSTTEKVSSSCMDTQMRTKTHTHRKRDLRFVFCFFCFFKFSLLNTHFTCLNKHGLLLDWEDFIFLWMKCLYTLSWSTLHWSCSYLRHTIRPCHQCHHHLSLSWFKLQDARGTIEFSVAWGHDSIPHQLFQQLPLGSDHMQLHSFPLLGKV